MKLEINDKIIKDMLSQTIKVFEDDDTNEDGIAALVEEIIKLWIKDKSVVHGGKDGENDNC